MTKNSHDVLNLSQVVEDLIYSKDLDKANILEILGNAIAAAYERKFPELEFVIEWDEKSLSPHVMVKSVVSANATTEINEISLRKARAFDQNAQIGETINVPFEGKIGRTEVLLAGKLISEGLKQLTQSIVFENYKDRVGMLISGTINKREKSGYTVNIAEDVVAFLPHNLSGFTSNMTSGFQLRAIVKQVLPYVATGHQIILDRVDSTFVEKLFEAEIPELLEGKVEIISIERMAGYKTKVLAGSKVKEIDPVGAFIGIKGSRIQPILREVNMGRIVAEGGKDSRENIDLISWSSNKETLIKNALRPAEISQVDVSPDGKHARVVVNGDQKGMVIGRGGANILLVSKVIGIDIKVEQQGENSEEEDMFGS